MILTSLLAGKWPNIGRQIKNHTLSRLMYTFTQDNVERLWMSASDATHLLVITWEASICKYSRRALQIKTFVQNVCIL